MAVEFDDFPNPTAHDDFGDGLNSKLSALKNGVNLSLQFRGDYDDATAYDEKDLVVDESGVVWRSLVDGNTGNPLETGDSWAVLGGGNLAHTWKGAWSGATAYVEGDAVSLSGSSYVCILGHTNHTPPNATYWNVLAAKGDTGATGATGSNGTNGTNGTNGNDGAPGADGDPGADGAGVPVGGTTGQVLKKVDGTDYNTAWADESGGGGGGGTPPDEVELTPSMGSVTFDPTDSDLFYFSASGDTDIVFDATGAYDGQEVLIRILLSADIVLDFTGDVVIPPDMGAPISIVDGYYLLRAVFDNRISGLWIPYNLQQIYFV